MRALSLPPRAGRHATIFARRSLTAGCHLVIIIHFVSQVRENDSHDGVSLYQLYQWRIFFQWVFSITSKTDDYD
jgi:hypothetical protein